MKLDLKEWIAKMTTGEPKEEVLSSTARLIRIGKCRILVLNGYTLQENITLAAADRPSHLVEAIMWASFGSMWYKSGNTAITTGGYIQAWTTYSYNAGSSQSALGSDENIISTLIWFVGGTA